MNDFENNDNSASDSDSDNSSDSDYVHVRDRHQAYNRQNRRNRDGVHIPAFSSSSQSSSSEENEKDDSFLAKNLLAGLNRLRQEERFCDITIKVNDIDIPAHKNILCAYSPYFNAMFTGSFKEKNHDTIMMDNLDAISFKLIIDYLYTGKLEITKDNVQNILDISNFLQIDPAQEICCKFLSKDVKDDNCLEFIVLAGKCGSASLLKTATFVATRNFFILYGKDEFLNIEIRELKKLLSEIYTRYYPSNFIFDLIIRWVEKIPNERLCYINELLTDFVDASRLPKDLVIGCKLLNGESATAASLCTQWLNDFERSQNALEHVIFTFNRLGYFPCDMYAPKTGRKVLIENGSKLLPGASYIGYKNAVYVHGGWKSKGTYTDESFSYNIFDDKWMKFIPLQIARAYHRTCILNDYMFVVGGGYTTRALECVETVDLSFGSSMIIDSMLNARSSMGISTYANSIYVVAGINGEENLVTCERFDPREGKWNLLPNRSYGYGICSSAVIGDSMYCAMGPGVSMERYDFKMNEWTLIKTQNNKYPNELFTIDNTLHGVFYDHVAEYNSFEGNWTVYREFDTVKSNFTTVVPFLIPEL